MSPYYFISPIICSTIHIMFQPNMGQGSSNLPTLCIILLALKLLELFKEQGTIKEGLIKFMMHL